MKMEKIINIDFNKPPDAARKIIQIHKDTLVSLRKQTDKSEELEWEIRVYDYMLEDPILRLDQYNAIRHANRGSAPMGKREVIKKLGWVIP